MPKPPNALFAPGGSLPNLLSSSAVSGPSLSTAPRRRHKEIDGYSYLSEQRNSLQLRYAHSSPNRPKSAENLSWPPSRSSTSIPTPYEIFKLHPSAPYSKRRFYELVKLYHPDSTCQSFASSSTPPSKSSVDPYYLPASLRLYRYRLIVQAHTILSDPAKRAAYDRYGAGWDGMPDIEGIRRENSERGWQSYAERADSPANCATWEDWEGWHEWRRQKEHPDYSSESRGWFYKQRPVYSSNGGFVVLIVFFTIAGAAHELSRAGRLSQSFKQQLEQVHVETLQELKKTRNESREFEHKDQRVQRFLSDRKAEPTFAEAIAGKEGMKSLPNPDVCRSREVQDDGLQSP